MRGFENPTKIRTGFSVVLKYSSTAGSKQLTNVLQITMLFVDDHMKVHPFTKTYPLHLGKHFQIAGVKLVHVSISAAYGAKVLVACCL